MGQEREAIPEDPTTCPRAHPLPLPFPLSTWHPSPAQLMKQCTAGALAVITRCACRIAPLNGEVGPSELLRVCSKEQQDESDTSRAGKHTAQLSGESLLRSSVRVFTQQH